MEEKFELGMRLDKIEASLLSAQAERSAAQNIADKLEDCIKELVSRFYIHHAVSLHGWLRIANCIPAYSVRG